MHYTQTVDIWSVGCIMAELITGKTLFPGDDHIDQLTRIMNVVGTPDDELFDKIQSEDARNYIKNLTKQPGKDFAKFFANASPAAVDLLKRTLNLDPDKRPTAAEVLAHEYLAAYHDEDDEPTTELLVNDFDNVDMTVEQWQKCIWDEIVDFHAGDDLAIEGANEAR